ncbi:efflux RND transporter periplasmic adaptor subunit [Oceanospirillum sediminis]|uniref:HlyD family secretion protein n=1 Tax=Oceanospirillum sediminis TaxID=2760088 RepID=A0A839IWR5_9GAMM|nr:HlyD family secretion protein [Oceanospirillum sediminis]MBB1488526.1 HlyD family secretion protein [Oceanospirillum sediminis]
MIKSKSLLFFVGVALGVVALAIAVSSRETPELRQKADRSVLVETQPLTRQSVAPEVTAYGRVMPKHDWRAVAEVKGRVIYRNPELENGRFLTAGTLLIEIDPTEYRLQEAQAQASLNATQVKLARMNQEEQNLNTSLKLEQQKMLLTKQELKRMRDLHRKKLISDSDLEQQEQNYFNQLKRVQDIENSLKLLPDDRRVTQAQLKVDQLQLEDTRRNLAKTRIILPFDGRISAISIEQDQVVALNETMIEAYKLGQVEIRAELAIENMRSLIMASGFTGTQGQLPAIDRLPLTAEVHFSSADKRFSWPARVTRIADTIAPDTATIGLYLEVNQDYRQLNLPEQPPLTKGLFVSAVIQGPEQSHYLVPEKAMHGKTLYLMTADQTLTILPVRILFRNSQGVAIRASIPDGSSLIVNDLIPAIEGMKLRPVNRTISDASEQKSKAQESEQ